MSEYDVFERLNHLKTDRIVFIDVGCHQGHFKDRTVEQLTKPSYWVGIDPVDHGVRHKYDAFFQKAIADVEMEEERLFFEYNEPGCNSLLRMNTELITHTVPSPGKWYVPWEIEHLTRERNVKVNSLKKVLDQVADVQDKVIHFVKIDTQGMDIEVVRSLRSYIPKVMWVQMECVTENVMLYKGQQGIEQDIVDMEKLGFYVYNIKDYKVEHPGSVEVDVIFKNANL
jgi:hypothetical protein